MKKPARKSARSAAQAAVEVGIDELARRAGTTVRNVRAYQDRGLLPPPRRRGRIGVYTEPHLARLRLIHQMLARGFSLANIAELIAAWESGRELEHILGFEAAVASPFVTELPTTLDATAVASWRPDALAAAIDLGLIERDGADLRVPSPRTLQAGSALIASGVPIAAVVEHFRHLRRDMEKIAKRLVSLVVDHVLGGRKSTKLPRGAELERLADVVWQLRSFAELAVDAELARALDGAAREQLGDRLDHVLEHVTARAARKPARVARAA